MGWSFEDREVDADDLRADGRGVFEVPRGDASSTPKVPREKCWYGIDMLGTVIGSMDTFVFLPI